MLEVVDAQIHAWDVDSSRHPWDPEAVAELATLPDHLRVRFDGSATTQTVLGMMQTAGVDAAVLVSPRIYGPDHGYAFAAAAAHPEKFGVVGPVDPATPDVGACVRAIREQPGGLGVRVVLTRGRRECLEGEGCSQIFAAAQQARVPLFLLAPGALGAVPKIARSYPDLQIVLDHLGGVASSSIGDAVGGVALLPGLLALARFGNVAVKCTNAPRLSQQGYPFADLWPHLHAVLAAFGPERTMWGSDITMHHGDLTYAQAVGYVRESDQLSGSEKALLLGQTLRRILRWPE